VIEMDFLGYLKLFMLGLVFVLAALAYGWAKKKFGKWL
jgi:hypothetical protein